MTRFSLNGSTKFVGMYPLSVFRKSIFPVGTAAGAAVSAGRVMWRPGCSQFDSPSPIASAIAALIDVITTMRTAARPAISVFRNASRIANSSSGTANSLTS